MSIRRIVFVVGAAAAVFLIVAVMYKMIQNDNGEGNLSDKTSSDGPTFTCYSSCSWALLFEQAR